jgi:hypothetical protein
LSSVAPSPSVSTLSSVAPLSFAIVVVIVVVVVSGVVVVIVVVGLQPHANPAPATQESRAFGRMLGEGASTRRGVLTG